MTRSHVIAALLIGFALGYWAQLRISRYHADNLPTPHVTFSCGDGGVEGTGSGTK